MKFPYYPMSWGSVALAFMGLFLVVLALVSLAPTLARRDALAGRSQALAGGTLIGLGTGLAGGIGFLALQSRIGPAFFLPPDNFLMGLLAGIALGALALLWAGALVALRSAPVVGVVLGALIGLLLFRMIFGLTAGFGGEVGLGVGREVGVMFGAAGGLLGGIAGHAIGVLTRNQRALPATATLTAADPPRPGWRWPLMGLALGALGGVLIGALGAYMGIFELLVPYNAQIPDVPPDLSPRGMLYNVLFGLGMFAIGGALVGCFLALQWMSSAGTGSRRHPVWLGAGLVAALIVGISRGLDQRGVGGPAPLLTAQSIRQDPVAGLHGLLIGLACGAVAGAILLFFALHSRAHPRWGRMAGVGGALIAGLLLLALLFWYTPVFGFSMY